MTRSVLIAILAASCGGEPHEPPGTKTSIFPVAKGNRWEYRTTGTAGDVGAKVQVITSTSAAGFVFHTVRGDRESISVQRIDAEGRLIRVSEIGKRFGVVIEDVTFDPYAIRVDLDDLEVGTQYAESFTERHADGTPDVTKSQTFYVDAVDEAVTVPLGTHRCVRIRRTTSGGPEKTYWYAKGVGKVKEIGGQTEELTKVEVVE